MGHFESLCLAMAMKGKGLELQYRALIKVWQSLFNYVLTIRKLLIGVINDISVAYWVM